MISDESRKILIDSWGPEVILRCCRDWPSHYIFTMGIGSCGICSKKPKQIFENWNQYISNEKS